MGLLQCIVYGVYQVITLPLRVINNILTFKINFLSQVYNSIFGVGVQPLFGR